MRLNRRHILAAAAMAATPAYSQTPPEARNIRVTLTTPQGAIVLALASERAPLTCANFLAYVDSKRLDKASFYRALRNAWAPATGLLQGGMRGIDTLPPVAHEPTTRTGLRHADGVISLARLEPGSATCDFFICIGDAPYLNANSAAPGDNLGYAAFGQVVSGMEVVRAIHALPTSPTLGEGVMKGQMLELAVPIIAARRTA